MKQGYLLYIEDENVVMNSVTTDKILQEKIKNFLLEQLLPFSKDRLGNIQTLLSTASEE